MTPAILGVDIGTSSSKGVLVDLDGRILRSIVLEHQVARPHPGWAEMDMQLWWDEFRSIARVLSKDTEIIAVGVSGIGPCVGIADEAGNPLRAAILYGIDSRARKQISRLHDELGRDEVVARTGAELSTQAAGPKLAWLAEHEAEIFERARMLFMPASWLGWRLTGEYHLDHHSASQCAPLYDLAAGTWHESWATPIFGNVAAPPLGWADEVIGHVTADAASETGLRAGTPVIAGTIDAWSEAVSADAHNPGDLMLMYGTTMFLVNTTDRPIVAPPLWSTRGAFDGTHCLAGGMATAGAITSWIRDLAGGASWETLLEEAAASGPGARGLLILPYFAGERTPIADPDARGVIAGLTVEHGRGDIYRATLEAIAFGVRHNIEAIRAGGGRIDRVVAVGGGVRGGLLTQIVSDACGIEQLEPTFTIGASFGAARLAARALDITGVAEWNPIARAIKPDPRMFASYNDRYQHYRQLYETTANIIHALATPKGN